MIFFRAVRNFSCFVHFDRFQFFYLGFLIACLTITTTVRATGLPDNPADWACRETPPSPQQIKTWCDAHPNRGQSTNIGKPASLLNLEEKNAYDKRLADFVINKEYVKLGWLHDNNWRMTGPYVGEPGKGLSYGVHPAVKVYYSPEVIDWLCDGRGEGEIPDGAMIVKTMHDIGPELDIQLDNNSCMTITAPEKVLDESFGSWTLMVKDQSASHDGWYWPNPYKGYEQSGNPPILDRSAFVLADQVPKDPTKRDPNMYPTSNFSVTGNSDFIPSQVYPYNGFGVACLNCHGSAKVESTFSSLENLMGEGIKYKGYDFNKTFSKPSAKVDFPAPLNKADPAFIKQFDQVHDVTFADAWQLRMPAETFDHVVSKPGEEPQFLTSDQCIACHDATISNDSLPNMMYREADGTLVNLSMYGEWRASPMGLAGRDPIFFSQLQSETNNLPQLTECIENTCLHCHGVLGQRQFSRDTSNAHNAGECTSIFPVPPPAGVPQGSPYPLSMVSNWQQTSTDKKSAQYGALSRDGISCMACHQMDADGIIDSHGGTAPMDYANNDALSKNQPYYTGNFVTTQEPEIFGPLQDDQVVPKPMQHVLGITPKYGAQITRSEMCGNCHNILLPEIDNNGTIVGASYEQTTHLEWANSVFAQPQSGQFQSCQDCHMPHTYNDDTLSFKIANIESSDFAPTTHRLPDEDITLKEVSPYPRHALHGLNIFLNQMFQQFPAILGIRQIDYMNGNDQPSLITGQNSMLKMARDETASVKITELSVHKNDDGSGVLDVEVLVTNEVGHYLPSGVGFRRAFLEFLVLDKRDRPIWASGRTNSLGMIVEGTGDTPLPGESPVENPKAWQPHHEVITREDQVQIYQEVILDSDNNVTTSFLRRIHHVKDNRVRPKGFDPAFFKRQPSKYIQELATLEGTEGDPYYSNPKLTGADRIRYQISLTKRQMRKLDNVQVTLFNQSIPPGYLQQRFRDANRGPKNSNEIERLFYLTSHLNVEAPKDSSGESFIKDWKLQISQPARQTISLDAEVEPRSRHQ